MLEKKIENNVQGEDLQFELGSYCPIEYDLGGKISYLKDLIGRPVICKPYNDEIHRIVSNIYNDADPSIYKNPSRTDEKVYIDKFLELFYKKDNKKYH